MEKAERYGVKDLTYADIPSPSPHPTNNTTHLPHSYHPCRWLTEINTKGLIILFYHLGQFLTCISNAGDRRDVGSIPGSGRSPGAEDGNPLQDSCLENPMDRGAWQAIVQRVTKNQTQLSHWPQHTACMWLNRGLSRGWTSGNSLQGHSMIRRSGGVLCIEAGVFHSFWVCWPHSVLSGSFHPLLAHFLACSLQQMLAWMNIHGNKVG